MIGKARIPAMRVEVAVPLALEAIKVA